MHTLTLCACVYVFVHKNIHFGPLDNPHTISFNSLICKMGEISVKITFQDYCLNEFVTKALFKENGINEN